MKVTPLAIDGAWLIESPVYPDSRGMFREWFRADELASNGVPNFAVKQANTSISNAGVIRGIHYSGEKSGQAKLVTCTTGSIVDVIVDLRPDSKDYGKYVSVELNSTVGKCVFISSGLGHGFQALEDQTVVTYLLDKEYSPNNEFGLNPLDPELGIGWPLSSYHISYKDRDAPKFSRN